jgi:hypothetical protein
MNVCELLSCSPLHAHMHTCFSNSTTANADVVVGCAFALPQCMSATAVIRFCNDCKEEYGEGVKHCKRCQPSPLLHIRCPSGRWTGRYDNWYSRHRPDCDRCNPDPAYESDEKHESKAEAKAMSPHDTSHGTFPLYVLIVSMITHTVI